MNGETATTLFPCTKKSIRAWFYAPQNENAERKLFLPKNAQIYSYTFVQHSILK